MTTLPATLNRTDMADAPLHLLLAKLSQGDEDAAVRVFRAYEPSLRLLVRRMLPSRLRAKFDSVDVVQSVWADLLRRIHDAGWRFDNPAQLRAFLIKMTRNRFIDRLRKYRPALEHQRALENVPPQLLAGSVVDQPAEAAQADELWERMLALCPPAHQRILLRKREGCSLAEIAQETGLHESSVRRILYELARKLAAGS